MRWRRGSAFVLLVTVASFACAQSPPMQQDVKATIHRGLEFLAKDAVAWKKKYNCVSCHHAGMVVWAMREAKDHGHAVDEPLLAELTRWVAESGEGRTSLPRPKEAPKALNVKPLWLALGLAADPKPDAAAQAGLKALRKTIKSDQLEKGNWSWWPETRPPMFGNSDESMTTLAALALHSAAESDAEAKAARDRALRWLAEIKSDDDPQTTALRLVLLSRLQRPDADKQPFFASIRKRQNPDGGWSQAREMTSDAWATGQALYALSHAGVKPDDPAVARGQSFLLKTQRADGSWPMTSRPIKPGGEGGKNLIPITGAGSAWAVLGLTRGGTTRP